MAVRPFDEIFRDFVTDGVPSSGIHHPHKADIRNSLNAIVRGAFPDNRVIKLNNANEGTANEIVVSASVDIPTAVYQVLYVLNVTQENTGPVTVSGAINRKLVTNTSQPIPAGYLKPGMAVLCIDTGSELRMLSYGDVESSVEDLVRRAEAAEAAAELSKDLAQNAASDAVSQGNVPIYSTRNAVETLEIPAGISAFRTNGFAVIGDGGAALYKKVDTEPSHAGKVRSTDGAWWELVTDVANVRMFGAKGDGVSDDSHSIQSAINFAQVMGGSIVYIPNTDSHYLVNDTLINDCSTPLTLMGDGRGLSKVKGGLNASPVLKIGDLSEYKNTPQRVMDLTFDYPENGDAHHIRAEACVIDIFNISTQGGECAISLENAFSFCVSDCSFGNSQGAAVYSDNIASGHNCRITSNGFFGCGNVLSVAAIFITGSDNILIEQNQIEGCHAAFDLSGCTAVRIISNYMEYGHYPFYFGSSTRRNSSVVMEGNWIAAYNVEAYIENVDGFYFRNNTIWNQVINFGPASNSSGICVGQNTLLDGGVINNPPWTLLTPINGWTSADTAPAVNATEDGLVSIRGAVVRDAGDGNQSCFVLPPSFRPRTSKRVFGINNSGVAVLAIIGPNGNVYLEAGAGFRGTVHLDVSFLR